jgi:hypothetical protein
LLQQPEGPSKSQGDEDEEAALDAEVITISSLEEPEAQEPAAPTEEHQENVELAPKDPEGNPLDSPEGIQSADPEITDVEFTPLESAQLDDAQLESAAVAVEPEEAAEEAESTHLDPQIG